MTTRRQSLTLRQIARLAGTSKSTVSRVLTRHPNVSSPTRTRVEKVMHEYGFQPNLFARGLAGGRTGLVAVLASEITSGFFAEVIHGIDEVTQLHGGHLLSCIAHGADDYIQLWREFARPGRVDGVVLVAPPMQIAEHAVKAEDVPAVLCAARPDKAVTGWSSIDTVTVNNDRAMEEVVRHLTGQGCCRLVHLAGPRDIHDARERRRSFLRWTKSTAHVEADIIQAGQSREDGRQAVCACLDSRQVPPDAFVAFNDATAYGVIEALQERGIPAGARVAVTGCDDEPASTILGLTSLHMPMRELGSESARLLFDRLEGSGAGQGARHSVLDMNLVVRSSSLLQPAPARPPAPSPA